MSFHLNAFCEANISDEIVSKREILIMPHSRLSKAGTAPFSGTNTEQW